MARIENLSSESSLRSGRLEMLVGELQQMIPMISSHLVEQLRDCAKSLPSDLSTDECLQIWRLSFTIWNTCVDIANNFLGDQQFDEDHAKLRQIASDLLLFAKDVDCIDSSSQKIASFFHKTGLIWHDLKRFELAAVCFEKVTELMSKVQEEQDRNATPRSPEDQEFMFDLFLARSRTAWELSHTALAGSLLARARGLLHALRDREHHIQLAQQYFEYGKCLIARQDTESEATADAIKYLEQAFEITSTGDSGNSHSESNKGVNETLQLMILRYLAAGHLRRDNYESALKCVVFLKSGPEHPSTSYLAIKALAGLHRYDEAEKEMFALIKQSTASSEACMSGIETLLQDPNRLEASKSAFLKLQSRCPSSKELPVRMLEYVLRRLPGGNRDTKIVEVALEIAVNEAVVATVTGASNGGIREILNDATVGSPSKEQDYIHVLLWNCGSEYFQAKDYETCIQLFETSMLYLPRNLDGNMQRAKSLRVLCLCRLALLQYDRANEYVTEAEKIDPNIACAFLKFKIYLQTSNEEAAIKQVSKMLTCQDFEPNYLSLASHEAMTFNCNKVAVSALSKFLDLPPGKRSKGKEDVVVIRNLVTFALQDSENQVEALTYMKLARTRLADVGFDKFFGSEDLGMQEATWFASTSWNQGLHFIDQNEWHLVADYFSCASDFYGALPESEENLRSLQKSLLLASSALLACSDLTDEAMRSVARMLEKCRKVHRALAMSLDPAVMVNREDSSEIFLNLLVFDLKGRNKDYKSQLDILNHSNTLAGFKSDYFLTMADKADKGPVEASEVAKTAFHMALKLILNSPSPDYKLVAMIIRKLIALADQRCKDGPDVLNMYSYAKEILAGLDPGEYAHEEIQWLAATAWNRAGLPVKFLRFSEAESWMEIAVEFANHDPRMTNTKLSMIEGLNEIRKKKQSGRACTDEHEL